MKLTLQLIALVSLVAIFKTTESKMTMDQIKNTLKPFKNSCIKKISPDVAMVEATKSGQFPEDATLMCFLKCVLSMMKVMKNGEILLPSIMQQIDIMMPDEYVETMKEICTNCYEMSLKVDDGCEKAYVFVKCYYNTNSELYFFP
ncbi:hypothetical protein TSAR_009702 [Trichomalopsis sarcophagae]|uniref:Uncharacterized protein n=1 Tax=Trichomalopsis sarcophagae TaxID=543379 RepID=A0A232EN62_9HYME|nr:hypothetical protein TSAR_009702 [Trichomalopsis sarcophagae]